MTRPFSRRQFVTAGTAMTCGLLLPVSLTRAATGMDDLTATRFRGCLDAKFTAHALSSTIAGDVDLWLRAVYPLLRTAPGMPPEVAQERSFELIFGTDAKGLTQDVYAVSNPELGTFEVLLVPSRDGTKLSATFNRLN